MRPSSMWIRRSAASAKPASWVTQTTARCSSCASRRPGAHRKGPLKLARRSGSVGSQAFSRLDQASAGCIAAVDDQLRAGHELGFVRRQIDGSPCDIVGLAYAPERMKGGGGGAIGFQVAPPGCLGHFLTGRVVPRDRTRLVRMSCSWSGPNVSNWRTVATI